MTSPLRLDRMPSPLGDMLVVAQDAELVALDFTDCEARLMIGLARRFPGAAPESGRIPSALREPIDEYFEGRVQALADVPVRLRGTAFQMQVWRELRRVRAGNTITYTELARRAGSPRAVRAAGHANSLNPVSLVVPCHRIVGVNGSLTGYAGGIERKRWLLEHEGALPAG